MIERRSRETVDDRPRGRLWTNSSLIGEFLSARFPGERRVIMLQPLYNVAIAQFTWLSQMDE